MKIGLIDADLLDNGTRHPNLALMKISTYQQKKSNIVKLLTSYEEIDNFDSIFISKVFSFTNIPAWVLKNEKVNIGGTGFFEDGGENLPYEIEHSMPDYNLYDNYISDRLEAGINPAHYSDYKDYSIGFATRGCFRQCSFCVNKKYKKAFRHAPLAEFLDETRKKIYLWDDNIFAFNEWETVFNELEKTGKSFQFRQGLDIRLLNDKKALRLDRSKYSGDIIFAFDHIEDTELIIKKLKLWRQYSSRTTKLYVLCGYKSQDVEDIINIFKRVKILMEFGCLPYIMRYESYKESELRDMYIQISRWCNQPNIFKKMSFREFCKANQKYHKNQDSTCSSLAAMQKFEETYPDIAKEYFDLRFEDLNKYKSNKGYSRRFASISPNLCAKNGISINISSDTIPDELLVKYLLMEFDINSCISCSKPCFNDETQIELFANKFVHALISADINKLIDGIFSNDMVRATQLDVPQFSNLNAVTAVPHILIDNSTVTYEKLGRILQQDNSVFQKHSSEKAGRNQIAYKKFGENHGKMAASLDLAQTKCENKTIFFSKTCLGDVFSSLDIRQQNACLSRLILRIPIVQELLLKASEGIVSIDDTLRMKGFASSTVARRRPNVFELLQYVCKTEGLDSVLRNITQ